MREKITQAGQWIEKGVKLFNLAFFVVSVSVWTVITAINLWSNPFDAGLLWSGFNQMYGELSFKISCIFLIIFNGLGAIRSFISGYMEMKENFQHVSTVGKFVKKVFRDGGES